MLQSLSLPSLVLGSRSRVLHKTSWFRPPTLRRTLRERALVRMMSMGSGGREGVLRMLVDLSPAGPSFSAMVTKNWERCYESKNQRTKTKKRKNLELCWVLFREVPPWLRKQKRQVVRCLATQRITEFSIKKVCYLGKFSFQPLSLIYEKHSAPLQEHKDKVTCYFKWSVKESGSSTVSSIPSFTFGRRC